MRTQITARHFKLTDEVKSYAEQEVQSLSKYFDNIIDVDVILEWQKFYRMAEIKMNVHGTILTAQEQADEIHKAINGAIQKMERQLVKYKDKLRGFDHEKLDTQPEEIVAEESEIEEG